MLAYPAVNQFQVGREIEREERRRERGDGRGEKGEGRGERGEGRGERAVLGMIAKHQLFNLKYTEWQTGPPEVSGELLQDYEASVP